MLSGAALSRLGLQVAPCTARHFLLSRQEKVTKEKATPTSGPSLREGCPHSIAAPGARCEGPSLVHRSSRGIHAAQPPPRQLRSAS
ncbi:hypothetical protein EGJ42_13855 [Stutzerimonas stutzeri]|nr:hypothetical protein EGJ42_13855 [Stutzerimonas stutzeri]